MRTQALRSGHRYWILAQGLLLTGVCSAQPFDGYNNYAGVGLLQTPSARTAAAGEFGVGLGVARPYHQLQFSLQILERLETTFRYTQVTNRRYGPEDFSGDQTYKDRAVDAKFLLVEEGRHWPAIAVGARDIGGTGLFSGEYLVANRRWYDLDFSLGLGWGRLGARGGLENPASWLSDRFEERSSDATPGNSGFSRLFRGEEIGLFGGLRWQTPIDGLSLIAEWDGNDYESEALDNDQKVRFPVNLGLNWRKGTWLDAGLAWERGSILTARLSFRTNFNRGQGVPKFLDPPMPPARARAEHPSPATNGDVAKKSPLPPGEGSGEGAVQEIPKPARQDARPAARNDRLRQALARQGFALQAHSYDAATHTLGVWFTQSRYRSQAEALGRLARVLNLVADDDVRNFSLIEIHLGFEAYRIHLVRSEVQKLASGQVSAEEAERTVQIEPPRLGADWHRAAGIRDYPALSFSSSPGWRQHIGGPDDFYFFQLWWRLGATLALSPRWNVSAQVGANIYNNFDDLEQASDSVLPHVRSDIVRYLKEGKNNLVRLETNYFFPLGEAWYGRVSAGLFEEMYGGVAGELLWRRFQSPLALGLDVARVRQRDYDQRFDFLDYEVTTGHLTAYYELRPLRSFVRLSYGRYLARDWGATLELSHYFDNGVAVGAFATKTNVSADDFGEGSFDKGFYLNIPMDLFFARSTRRSAPLLFRPLTRDGGQKVRAGQGLYGATATVPALGQRPGRPLID